MDIILHFHSGIGKGCSNPAGLWYSTSPISILNTSKHIQQSHSSFRAANRRSLFPNPFFCCLGEPNKVYCKLWLEVPCKFLSVLVHITFLCRSRCLQLRIRTQVIFPSSDFIWSEVISVTFLLLYNLLSQIWLHHQSDNNLQVFWRQYFQVEFL